MHHRTFYHHVLLIFVMQTSIFSLRAQMPPLPGGLDSGAAGSDTTASATSDAGPALPAGLGNDGSGDEPALPPGLGPGDSSPPLPGGLGTAEASAAAAPPPDRTVTVATDDVFARLQELDIRGFWDTRLGFRLQNDPYQKNTSLGEMRLQLDWQRPVRNNVTLKLTGDLLYDPIVDQALDLERGYGWLDLRQANAQFTPLAFMDVKIGRQILTWGTGDQVFINDLFPKDWQSFLSGRDTEYLKAPSDAVKMSLFHTMANLDLVYTPAFDADRYISGRRLSYFNRNMQRLAGRDAIVDAKGYNKWFSDDELALRLSRNISGYEMALYGYLGRWKSPAGYDAVRQQYVHPRLHVWGGSMRGQILRGIGNMELGYYDSRQDQGGDNPLIPNSQFRFLAGYERDLPKFARDFTVGIQYYLEYMLDYGSYERTLPPAFAQSATDEQRHVFTLRLTKMYMNQNMIVSLFTFYSPSDRDVYLRPQISYKVDDHWTVEGGGNIFAGADDHTFFSQFEKNSNAYLAVRYGF